MGAAAEAGRGDRAPLQRWREALAELPFLAKAGVAAAAGVTAVAALPPLHQVYALIPAVTALVWLLDGITRVRVALAVGWVFGFGFFTAGLYWIYYAFLVDAGDYGWLAPFGVLGLAALLGLFTAGMTACAAFGRRTGVARVIRFAAAWVLWEWVRSWGFSGFPWNLLGTVWTFSDAMMQPAAWIGTYGLGFVTCALAAMPAILGDPALARWRGGLPLALCGIVLAGWFAAGELRLTAANDAVVSGVRLRLVQPNIPQSIKWRGDLRLGHLVQHIRMSRESRPGEPSPTVVVWAETAVSYVVDVERSHDLLAAIAQAAPPGGHVIFGAPRARPGSNELYNSLFAVDGAGTVEAVYDKTHLVPFGEYVPLRGLLAPLSKLVQARGDFIPGDGLKTLTIPGLPPFSPLICYEIIFPGEVVAPGPRPSLLLNITNDAWFGVSAGPYQHFASARMRAVEEGLPLVRVANTGISAVVDALGRVRAEIALDREGVVDSDLPAGMGSLTLYSRLGTTTLVLLLLVVYAGCRFGDRRRPANHA